MAGAVGTKACGITADSAKFWQDGICLGAARRHATIRGTWVKGICSAKSSNVCSEEIRGRDKIKAVGYGQLLDETADVVALVEAERQL
jgi:hypothetical protein